MADEFHNPIIPKPLFKVSLVSLAFITFSSNRANKYLKVTRHM